MPPDGQMEVQEREREFVFPRWQIEAFKRWFSRPVPVLDKDVAPTKEVTDAG